MRRYKNRLYENKLINWMNNLEVNELSSIIIIFEYLYGCCVKIELNLVNMI